MPLGTDASLAGGSPAGTGALVIRYGRRVLRGKNGSAQPRGTHMPPGTAWHGDETLASPVPRSGPVPTPVSVPGDLPPEISTRDNLESPGLRGLGTNCREVSPACPPPGRPRPALAGLPQEPPRGDHRFRLFHRADRDLPATFDHVIALSEAHVRRLGRELISHYHGDRTHLGLDKDSPISRPVEPKPTGAKLVSLPRVGGLHHRYVWQAAA